MQNRKSTCKFFLQWWRYPSFPIKYANHLQESEGAREGQCHRSPPPLAVAWETWRRRRRMWRTWKRGGEHLSQLASPQEQGRATSQSPSPGRVVEITDHGNQKCMYVHWQSLETKPLKSNCLSCLHLFSDVSFPQFVHTLPLSQYIRFMFTSANK